MNTRIVTLVLAMDAAANALLAAVLLVAARPLAAALGGIATWPLIVLAVLLGVNALLCGRAVRSDVPDAGLLRGLAVVDAAFAVAVVGLTLADPTGAAAWLRWTLGALGVVVAAVAGIKWLAASRLTAGAVARG
jgi:hypothetical protein